MDTVSLALVVSSILLSGVSNALVVSDELTNRQRMDWRGALDFPAYCENGKYEWLDSPSMPNIYFDPLPNNRTLIYNVCERYAYQDEVNVFFLEKSSLQPQLITFPVPILDQGVEIYIDKDGNKLESIPVEAFKIELKQLIIERGINVLPDGLISVEANSNGPGTCGTFTVYNIDKRIARIIEFRAQISCNNTRHDETKWPLYKLDCPTKKQDSSCKVIPSQKSS